MFYLVSTEGTVLWQMPGTAKYCNVGFCFKCGRGTKMIMTCFNWPTQILNAFLIEPVAHGLFNIIWKGHWNTNLSCLNQALPQRYLTNTITREDLSGNIFQDWDWNFNLTSTTIRSTCSQVPPSRCYASHIPPCSCCWDIHNHFHNHCFLFLG